MYGVHPTMQAHVLQAGVHAWARPPTREARAWETLPASHALGKERHAGVQLR